MLRVERKGNSPNTAPGVEAKLLHVAVMGSAQSSHVWSSQSRSERLQYLQNGEGFILYFSGEIKEFISKVLMEKHLPFHVAIMTLKAYSVKVSSYPATFRL